MAELHLFSPKGFRGNGVYAGIKSKRTPDVGLLVCDAVASAAAVFTRNRVVSAAVKVGRAHVADGRLRAVVVNAGNANACTGPRGDRDARRMCELAASAIDCDADDVLPSSTGIIGHALPMDRVERGIAGAGADLGDSAEHARRFSDAILTTDTRRKAAAVAFKIGRARVTLAGVTKGSGMIGPRLALPGGESASATRSGGLRVAGRAGRAILAGHHSSGKRPAKHATMLAYLTTDAHVPAAILRRLLGQSADVSFNAVTVDDQASTNDTAAILASGAAGARVDSRTAADILARALREVCQSLAYQIAADGEGATKVVVVHVSGAKSDADARVMARCIANSPLVKCAMHGNDPNWGRIVCAAGFSGAAFDAGVATLRIQGTVVFRRGQPVQFNADAVSRALGAKEVRVELDCRLGKSDSTCWTCDLSKDYVTINADYHT
jgi:glutamate N-acetyltransferase/amino-acid N-acetyltransferase